MVPSCQRTSARAGIFPHNPAFPPLRIWSMEQRKLGRSGPNVSALGLGLMSMSGVYGNASDDESISVIHYALDQGINFLDSADMYGWGHNETLLGKALKGRRDKAFVATKFGQVKLADGKQGVDGR